MSSVFWHPAVLLCCPLFLQLHQASVTWIKGGGHRACHGEKCKWQSSLEKEERVRAEVETLPSPSGHNTSRPQATHFWVNFGPVTTPVVLGTSSSHTHTHTHTHTISSDTLWLAGRQPLPGDCISVSLWGILAPWGKAERPGAWSLCEMLMWNKTGWV